MVQYTCAARAWYVEAAATVGWGLAGGGGSSFSSSSRRTTVSAIGCIDEIRDGGRRPTRSRSTLSRGEMTTARTDAREVPDVQYIISYIIVIILFDYNPPPPLGIV